MTSGRPRILLGTTNSAKIDRLRACLEGWPFDIVTIDALTQRSPVQETGGTHREIAEAKALEWASISGGLAIASDGGIDIPALGSQWDSLLTRRATGEDVTDNARAERLVALTAHLTSEAERTVIMREAIAIAAPDHVIQSWEAEGLSAMLRHEPSPARIEGFWLASLLHIPRYGKPYSELTADELRHLSDPWETLRTEIQAWLTQGGGYARLLEF